MEILQQLIQRCDQYWTKTKNGMRRIFSAKYVIAATGVVLIVLHLFTDVKSDWVLLALLAFATLPWWIKYVRRLELPGNFAIELHQVQSAVQQIIGKTTPELIILSEGEEVPPPKEFVDLRRDPNLALVRLRIDIEERLRKLASRHDIEKDTNLFQIISMLEADEILNRSSADGLTRLIQYGNQAAHGANVRSAAGLWARSAGPEIIDVLDAKIRDG